MSSNQLDWQNFFSTTLASTITASDTVIYLNSLPTPSEGFLVIEPDSTTGREVIYYTSKGVNYVTCPSVASGRGVGGTTAASHSSGSTVQMNVVAEDLRGIQSGDSNTGMHTYFDENFQNYVLSGASVTQATGLIASISSGTAYINGRRLSFGAMSKTVTASKDTYFDLLETDGSNIATISYTELASGATGSTPVSNGVHIGMVRSSASAIATIQQTFTDTLGNPLKPTSPVSTVGLHNPYKFSVYRSGAFTFSAGAFAKVQCEIKVFDTNGNYDNTTNYRYTAPVSGFYCFNGAIGTAVSAGAFLIVSLYKNGSELCRGTQLNTSGACMAIFSEMVQASAGDYFEMYVFSTNAVGMDTNPAVRGRFSGFLISQS